MQRHHSYPYSFAPPAAPPRYTASHSTSSAQSPSANPDEDWTKISDLAERRRIQNRIAQRNYRKKLKRRLEDLERRAGSSSDSPEQQHSELVPSQGLKPADGKKKRPSKPGPNGARPNRSPIPPLTPSFPPRDDNAGMFSHQYTRQLSTSPPPSLTYSQYPGSDAPPIHAPYPQHAPFHTLPAPYPDFPNQPLYLPPLPLTRPSYENAPMKSEAGFNSEEMISHFNMSYPTTVGGVEVPTTQSYTDPNAYTPPLSVSESFDQSRTTSPSEQSMMYPRTPKSLSLSPHTKVH